MAGDKTHDHGAARAGTVLVATRHRAVAEALSRSLTGRGVRAETTELSPEALAERAEELRPAVVVLGHADVAIIAALGRLDEPRPHVLVLDDAGAPTHVGPDGSLPLRGVPVGTTVDQLVRILAHGAAPPVPSPRRPGPTGRSPERELLDRLTDREEEVLRLMLLGAEGEATAALLGISPHTVRTHLQSIYAKLGVHSQLQAALVALRAGMRVSGSLDGVQGDVA